MWTLNTTWHRMLCLPALIAFSLLPVSEAQETRRNGIDGRLAFADGSLVIEVNDHRPLARAADLIELRFGIPISYEDPEYDASDDLEDFARAKQPQSGQKSTQWLAPRAVRLSARINEINSESASRGLHASGYAEELAREVLSAQRSLPLQRRFRLDRLGAGLLIRPAEGASTKRGPDGILDTKISIDPADRSVSAFLRALCGAIEAETGLEVKPGTLPLHFIRTRTGIGATEETGRTVLMRLLDTLKHRMSYRLFYGPGRGYFLNLHYIEVEVKTRTGTIQTVPVINQQP